MLLAFLSSSFLQGCAPTVLVKSRKDKRREAANYSIARGEQH